ncbi:MAG: protein phosphatase 2C domain-containing protein [Oscillospiraceae bacterium]|nr:protein phosphatase 2C domain-containing protein [Oscillospiraceae bacterium]
MLGSYNLSLQGKSHITSGKVCQDSSHTMVLENGWAVALIADGLGSAKHSDIGAFLAVSSVIAYLKKYIPKKWNVSKIQPVLRNAYSFAFRNIIEKSFKDGNPIADYDTTLTVAVYNGSQIVFSHVGDGGIITLSRHGDFLMLTTPQKGDEFNSVNPLRSEKWAFGSSANDVCAFSMFTDGIYDVVCPWILSEQKQPIYINYIRPFMDRNVLKADTVRDFVKIKKEVEAFLNSEYNSGITDDKTVATVINTGTLPAVKSAEYYAEPDWEKLQKENRRKLYS